jgi:hypothetical protein
VQLARRDRQSPRLNRRDAEQILDQMIHPLTRPSDDAERSLLAGVRSRHVEHCRRCHRYRVERIAQVVGDDAKDFLAGVDDSLSIVVQAVHRNPAHLVHHDAAHHVGHTERENAGECDRYQASTRGNRRYPPKHRREEDPSRCQATGQLDG